LLRPGFSFIEYVDAGELRVSGKTDELIADATHDSNHAGGSGLFQFLSKIADVTVHRPFKRSSAWQTRIDKFAAREYPSRRLGHMPEHPERPERQ
jgi:hypothetical protein